MSPRNKADASQTVEGFFSGDGIIDRGLNFEYMSPKTRPSTGTPIHKNTQIISGVIDVLASSLPINPGRINKDNIKTPNIFPNQGCLCSTITSFFTSTDFFQEIFKKTKVKIITQAETFKTVSKGMGRSPTLPIP